MFYNYNPLAKQNRPTMLWFALLLAPFLAISVYFPLNMAQNISFTQTFLILDGVICALYLGDLYLRLEKKLFLPHQIKPNNVNPKKKKIPYKKSLFFKFDLIASFPFEIIAFYCVDILPASIIIFIRAFTIIKLTRFRSLIPIIQFLPKQIKIALFVTASFLAIHWITCGWILINEFSANDFITTYNISLYWAITTLTTVGYGDITPQTNISRMYTVVVMLGGVTTFGLLISHFFQLMLNNDKYTKQKKEQMGKLHAFLAYYEIPSGLRSDVYSFYTHLLNKNISEEDTKILNTLPRALQEELNLYTRIKLIKNVHIFHGLPHNCLKQIATKLEQVDFTPGSYIIKEGDIGAEMYIIAHGEVEILNQKNLVIAKLQEGQFFGEIALMQDTIRNANVKTSVYCDLYTLNKEAFTEIIFQYPALGDKFKKIYSKRKTDREDSSSSKQAA